MQTGHRDPMGKRKALEIFQFPFKGEKLNYMVQFRLLEIYTSVNEHIERLALNLSLQKPSLNFGEPQKAITNDTTIRKFLGISINMPCKSGRVYQVATIHWIDIMSFARWR